MNGEGGLQQNYTQDTQEFGPILLLKKLNLSLLPAITTQDKMQISSKNIYTVKKYILYICVCVSLAYNV